ERLRYRWPTLNGLRTVLRCRPAARQLCGCLCNTQDGDEVVLLVIRATRHQPQVITRRQREQSLLVRAEGQRVVRKQAAPAKPCLIALPLDERNRAGHCFLKP